MVIPAPHQQESTADSLGPLVPYDAKSQTKIDLVCNRLGSRGHIGKDLTPNHLGGTNRSRYLHPKLLHRR